MAWTLHDLPDGRIFAHVWDRKFEIRDTYTDDAGAECVLHVIPDQYQTGRSFDDERTASDWAAAVDRNFSTVARHTARMLEGIEAPW